MAGAYYCRAWVNAKRGEQEKCIRECDEAIRLDGKMVGALKLRGCAYRMTGLGQKAIADETEALSLQCERRVRLSNSGACVWRFGTVREGDCRFHGGNPT